MVLSVQAVGTRACLQGEQRMRPVSPLHSCPFSYVSSTILSAPTFIVYHGFKNFSSKEILRPISNLAPAKMIYPPAPRTIESRHEAE